MKLATLEDTAVRTTGSISLHEPPLTTPMAVNEGQRGATYREIAERSGKSLNAVRKAVRLVEAIVGKSVKEGSAAVGQEVRLTAEGAEMMLEYLQDSEVFKARHTKAIVLQEDESLTVSESEEVQQNLQSATHSQQAEIIEIKAAAAAMRRVALESQASQIEEAIYQKIKAEGDLSAAISDLEAAAGQLSVTQNGKLEKVSQVNKKTAQIRDKKNEILGKLGISL
jgi:hypothetical protein